MLQVSDHDLFNNYESHFIRMHPYFTCDKVHILEMLSNSLNRMRYIEIKYLCIFIVY